MGDTQAERLARTIDQDEDGGLLGKAFWCLKTKADVEHAQSLLDILYSWRTCGNCKHWQGEPGKYTHEGGKDDNTARCDEVRHHLEINLAHGAYSSGAYVNFIEVAESFRCKGWEEKTS